MHARYIHKIQQPDDPVIKIDGTELEWEVITCAGCGRDVIEGVAVGKETKPSRATILCGNCVAEAAYELGKGRKKALLAKTG